MDALVTSTLREIKNSLGRYIAIMAITALGVGFFAGLRFCRPMLVEAADEYLQEQHMHDFCLLSSLGWSEEQVLAIGEDPSVRAAQGAYYEDVLIELEGGDQVFRIYSFTEGVDVPKLTAGRMPRRQGECLVDKDLFGPEMLGKTISLSDNNSEETVDALAQRSFIVVGLGTSPLYMSGHRGSSSLGNGHIAGFMYVPEGSFTGPAYKELYISLRDSAAAYSEDYEELIQTTEPEIRALAEAAADSRYSQLVTDDLEKIDQGRQELAEAQKELDSQRESAQDQVRDMMSGMGLSPEAAPGYYNSFLAQVQESFDTAQADIDSAAAELDEAQAELEKIDRPSVYVLTRDENAGYASFKQDSAIIEKISIVFPVFFFMVAALVCVTTMSRMVDEQRTQIGVWKAMGYDRRIISLKYVIYAGSAGIIGCVAGFLAFTYFLPMVFWFAYSSLYNFTKTLSYTFRPGMFVLSLAIAVFCTAGVSMWSCRRELREAPASILRPKAPKDGKRILLERIGFIWRRIGFLHKVSLRNVVRYKQRFFLMLLGVSGCTALLLTGFGIRDSIQNVTDYQYGEISLYDAELSFSGEAEAEQLPQILDVEGVNDYCLLSQSSMDIQSQKSMRSAKVSALAQGSLEGFMDLHRGETAIAMPEPGQLILSKGLAEKLQLAVGDSLILTNGELKDRSFVVSGVFDNHIGDTVFIHRDDMQALEGGCPVNGAYLLFEEGADGGAVSAALLEREQVAMVSLSQDMKDTVDSSFKSLDMVVVLIIICAGALAFIVLFNLININIGERIREIATLKVLGFYNGESSAYVFREVNLLTALGALLGLGLGRLLHAFVMAQIRPDGMCFDVRIAWPSYILSLLVTFFFAFLVRLTMTYKLRRICMSESLRSVE